MVRNSERSIEKKAKDWIEDWVYKIGKKETPSKDIIDYFNLFKPKDKLELYRIEPIIGKESEMSSEDYASYTRENGFINFCIITADQGREKVKVIKREVEPDEILVDITKLPFGSEYSDEVIVKRKYKPSKVEIKEYKCQEDSKDIFELD